MREGFYIGPFLVHYYGILISFGIIAAVWVSLKMAKKQKLDEEFIWDILPWVVIAGVIGARIWHILTPPQSMVDVGLTTKYYLTHPLDAIAIWNGGLGIPGAVIGGALAVWILARKRKISFGLVVDVVAPGLALAQAIGRWGNFLNQELYGMPTDLPWAIFIEPAHRLPEFANQAYYHPLFLYESIANLIICGLLIWLINVWKDKKSGMIFQVYLVLYPTLRFFLEFLRLDPSNVRNLNVNQALMAVVALSSAVLLIWRMVRKSKPAVSRENITADAISVEAVPAELEQGESVVTSDDSTTDLPAEEIQGEESKKESSQEDTNQAE